MSKKIIFGRLNMKTVASPLDNIVTNNDKMSNSHFVYIQNNMIDLLSVLCKIYRNDLVTNLFLKKKST